MQRTEKFPPFGELTQIAEYRTGGGRGLGTITDISQALPVLTAAVKVDCTRP